MKSVLIVDDEDLFTHSLSEGLPGCDSSFEVHIAANGRDAIGVLEERKIDLVVTDLQMPVMDGFELLAFMSRSHPELPVLVMTAFGTPEIEARLRALGFEGYIEKPIDLDALAARIAETLAKRASGFVRGITLPTFLQIIEMERKTCTLRIAADRGEGHLFFKEGALLDAETGDLSGEVAAHEILSWDEAGIEIASGCRRQKPRIASGLHELLLDSLRMRDEKTAGGHGEAPATPKDIGPEVSPQGGVKPRGEEERVMSALDKLKELSAIEGFAGVGVFTPSGENLALLNAGTGFKAEIGVLANNVLMSAQKASLEMGTGRGQQVHIEAEKAHILARCLNEGTDPLKSQPGKAHIHMVLVLTSDSSIGMAKMKVNSLIERLGEDFRM